jgi:hypothetical protein
MAISFATVRNNLYTAVYDHLQTGTYAITSNNIHPSFNSEQVVTEGYPQVIIDEPKLAIERGSVAPREPIRNVPFKIPLEIHHNSAANAKTVADEVTNKIITGNQALRTAGLMMLEFDEEDVDVREYQENKSNHVYKMTLKGVYRALA